MEEPGDAGDRGAARAARAVPSRSRSTGSRSPRSRRSPTGASRGSSGGATSSRSGRRRTARSICAATEEEAQERAGAGVELTRDPDVLDTWFSSALWPFATLGWPEQTPELEAYYPGNVNSTAREIIRLWENRMIWAGLELMGEVPFTDVIIHSTVLAADGRRMSKSLGTGVDPLEMIDAHGADATRYGLLKISSTQDVRFSPGRDRGGPQAREQALERLAADPPERRGHRAGRRPDRARGALDPGPDRPRARAGRGGVGRVRLRDRDERALPPHVRRLLRLVRRGGQAAALRARARRLRDGARRARAPARPPPPGACPHVTEEIWSHLPGERKRLIVSPWPAPDGELSRARAARSTASRTPR